MGLQPTPLPDWGAGGHPQGTLVDDFHKSLH